MKRYIALLVVGVLLLSVCGCAKTPNTKNGDASKTKVTTATTTTTATATTTGDVTPTGCAHMRLQAATCTEAAKCQDCGQTEGEALGHDFVEKNCTRCGRKNPAYTSRVDVIGITLDQTEADLLIGETVSLVHTVNPKNATDKTVTWKTSNPSIATVDANGAVTAIAVGEATITVSSVNGKTAICKIKVQEIVVEMPIFPTELIYNAQHNDVSIFLLMEDIEYTYTKTAADGGTLLILFDGWLSYAGDGHGGYTYPEFGWRLRDDSDAIVAEDIARGEEALTIGNSIVGLTAEIPSVKQGRYRLELYNLYVRK